MKLKIGLCVWVAALTGCWRTETRVQETCEREPEPPPAPVSCPVCPKLQCPSISDFQVKCYEAVVARMDAILECREDAAQKEKDLQQQIQDLKGEVERWQGMYYSQPECD